MASSIYRLGDGCTVKHGFAFKGMSETPDSELPIVVNIGNFQYSGGFRFESTRIQRYSGEFPEQFILQPGDVLVVMTCQTPGGEILGIPGRIPSDESVYLHNQRMGKLVITRPDELSLDYLYYLFLSPAMNAHLVASATGAKILHTAPSRIESFKWKRPPLSEQQRIGSILSAYDDLIENNTKRIKILEEIARSLYREWFVNFRFPGHEKTKFTTSKLGNIPEGWATKRIDDVASVNARSIKRGEEPEDLDYVDIASVSPGVIEKMDRFAFEAAPGRARRLVQAGDTIWSTVRPNRRSYAFLTAPPPTMVVSTGFAVLSPQAVPPSFLYFSVTTDEFVSYIMNRTRGSAYPACTGRDFEEAPILIADNQLMSRFDGLAGPILDETDRLRQKNTNLRATRDILLPRLISGEIDVSSLRLESAAS